MMFGRQLASGLTRSMLLLSIVASSFFTPAAASSSVPLGINLAGLYRWNTDWPLVDEMKRAEVRTRRGAPFYQLTDEGDLVDWDDNGWPNSLPADASNGYNEVIYTLFTAPYATWNAAPPPAGIFQVMYDGEGTLEYRGAMTQQGSCGLRCDLVLIDPQQVDTYEQLVQIAITQTNPADHLRNIRVIWPGGICDGDNFTWHQAATSCTDPATYQSFVELTQSSSDTIFHPDFLRDLRDFKTIRFLNWQQSNTSTLSNPPYDLWPSGSADIDHETLWAERRPLSFATWAFEPTETQAQRVPSRGAPIEALISLVNVLQADAWLHIPFDASNDYIQQFATLVKGSLQHNQHVYIEYGNEGWNGGWPFNRGGSYLSAKGDDFWGTAAGTSFDRQMQFFAKRTSEICGMWKSVWGAAADQLTCVMGSQAASPYLTRAELECPLWANDARNTGGQNCASQVDAVAIAPYFADDIGNANNESQLATWSLENLFQEINEGGVLISNTPAAMQNGNGSLTTNFYHSPEAQLLLEMSARLSGSTVEPLPLLPATSSGLALTSAATASGATTSALDISDARVTANIEITNEFNLELLAYEGGQHMLFTNKRYETQLDAQGNPILDAQGNPVAVWVNETEFNAINDLFIAANRDPRMGATYIDYLNRWKQAGGGLFTLYSSVTPALSYGSWGLKESQGQAATPKRTAAQQMLDGSYCWGNECSKTLTHAQWHQISIPCEPGVDNTVADFFADDIAAPFTYGDDWAIFSFDAASGSYVNPGLSGIMERGTGYWILQQTGADVEIDTPVSCTMTAPEPAGAVCTATKGCFAVPLVTKSAAVQWNLSGYGLDDALPFNRYTSTNTTVPTLKITSNVACSGSGCLPDQAQAAATVHNQLWRYNPATSAYDLIEDDQNLLPWDGFWVPTLTSADGSTPALVFPDY